MARSRDVMSLAALITGAAMAAGSASPVTATMDAAAPVVPAQYFHEERPAYQAPPPRYYAPPPPRRVCWTENRRILVGYDRYRQPIYQTVPRRVCGYR
ncbi:hypothetical protein KPL78_12615 [Roseomonas sp. HJA6]|uniref:Lectin-like protein BA14k n=1 Tax=Roseomonas alba TaxID=2846776 RepID=A0ABS7A8S0_9PROT|nr:hypothetical protein [Neoroseomonas alba]MBW6398698.1 hypothetical protein [Neoroseomonas alba]